ncbi:MAG: hypothetical protein E2O38_11860 [Proteobacteria bacterium]|nr:MAG: hypothetical protein E2O38_11860 [Pseudomonadota bacterium]
MPQKVIQRRRPHYLFRESWGQKTSAETLGYGGKLREFSDKHSRLKEELEKALPVTGPGALVDAGIR